MTQSLPTGDDPLRWYRVLQNLTCHQGGYRLTGFLVDGEKPEQGNGEKRILAAPAIQ
jgi:hypothetical protein